MVISTGSHDKITRRKQHKIEREEAEHIYKQLSNDEKEVVMEFVNAGGSVLTWSQVNNSSLLSSSIESLIQRKILWTSTTADGMRETFAIDSDIFDVGQER